MARKSTKSKVKECTEILCWEDIKVSKKLLTDIRKCTTNARTFLNIPLETELLITLYRGYDQPEWSGTEFHEELVNEKGERVVKFHILVNLVTAYEYEYVNNPDNGNDGNSGEPERENEFKVKQGSTKEILETLCHEIIHVGQFIRGDFGPIEKNNVRCKAIWKGRKYKFRDQNELGHDRYMGLPWEREARMFAPLMVENYLMNRRYIK